MVKRKLKVEEAEVSITKAKKSSLEPPKNYSRWLMKSEPESRLENGVDVKFGLEDLKLMPEQTSCWDGVRNYQVRLY